MSVTRQRVASAAVAELLAEHADAAVAAIGRTGLIVPLPAHLSIGTHEVISGRSAVELIESGSRPAVLTAWERVKATGASVVTARLRSGQVATAHLIDATDEWGVVILVVVPGGADPGQPEPAPFTDLTPALPRLGRMRKSEISVITEVDESAARMLGWAPIDLIGRRTLELIHPDDQQRGVECWVEMLGSPGQMHRFRGRHLRGDGTWMWVDVVNHNLLHDPEHGDVLAEIIDASEEMAAHAALAEREELLNRLTEALPFGVAQLAADGTIVYANDRWSGLLGAGSSAGESERFGGVVPSDRERLERVVADALAGDDASGLEVRVQPAGSGRERMCQVEVRSLGADGPTGVLLCVTDVTESARLRQELEVRATVDDLTSCLNRSSILDVAAWAVGRCDVPDAATAALFVDVDHFKSINDEYGHAAGDAVLREVACRLRSALRSGDRVGRLGGDEFLVVCPDLLRPDLAMRIAHRAVESIGSEFALGDTVIPLRASIGVAWSLNEGLDADTLVAMADAAMYDSKRDRSGPPVLRSTRT